MCGIVGQINYTREKIDRVLFDTMSDTLIHRGPDGYGTELLHNDSIAFGHRRLSIIDLSDDGKQPMCNEDNSIWITFNGEIYNFYNLKKELVSKGHVFKSKSDTEVLIHGYEEWGIKNLLKKLKGMFAFVIYDQNNNKLIAARDRFGIKPFYYYKDNEKLIFASELKAITKNPKFKKEIDNSSIADFFTYSYVPNPKTIWKNTKKLSPASFFEVNLNEIRDIREEKYWKLENKNTIISDKDAIEKANALIHRATKEHLTSDVPVGLFLSGGYDSSTLLMHMKDLKYDVNSFSIGFDNSNRSEHLIAREISSTFGSNHYENILSEEADTFSLLEKLAFNFDEPFAISSMIPYYLASELAIQHSKVVIVGDGGDEAFAGYKWHYEINNYYKNLTLKKRIKEFILSKSELNIQMYNKWMTGVYDELINTSLVNKDISDIAKKQGLFLFKKYYDKTISPVKSWQLLDVHTFIPEPCLTRADRTSMAHSLEVRVPFLDHEIFEFTFQLNEKTYIKNGIKKFLIHENLKNRVSKEIIDMPKRGFSFQHLYRLYDDKFYQLIKYGFLSKNNIINVELIKQSSTLMKFHVLVLELWFQKNYL